MYDFLIQKYLFHVKKVNYKKWEKLKEVNPRECDSTVWCRLLPTK